MQNQPSTKGHPVSIKIYSKKVCNQCTMTKKLYDRAGVTYETVTTDGNEVLQDRLRAQGHMALPVVITPGDSWAGFQPERINASIDEYSATATAERSLSGPNIT